MRKVLITIATIAACAAILSAIAALVYTNSDEYKSDVFEPGTIINGVNCSDMTIAQAETALTDEWNSRTLVVYDKMGKKLASYTDFGCEYDLEKQLSSLRRDHIVAAGINHFIHIPYNAQIAMNVSKCGESFEKEVKESQFLNTGHVVETENAYVDLDDPEFPIVPEVYGNKTDEEAFLQDVLRAVSVGTMLFEFDENAYRAVPEVKDDDPELLAYQRFCREYLSQKISYKLGKESFTIAPKDLVAMMNSNMTGTADEKKVSAYVEDLKKNYDIVGGEQTFSSLTGKTFKVSGGDFGWVIDQEGETSQLIADINSHRDVNREPVFSQRGSGTYSKKLDVGKTYIDIDITEQHVVYFEKGKKKFETDCVTGCVIAGHATPTGVYSIQNKLQNITLVGGGKKGSKTYYESFVNYWMAFIGSSIGLHDASWRNTFGGEIYKTAGSHGCVNLPTSEAPKLYKLLKIGTPVIVHY